MMGKAIISGGAIMVAPVGGTPIADVAVGSALKLLENGKLVDYLVVHSGLPSTLYDSSCDGIWLLRKDVYSERIWDSTDNDYGGSKIHTYLNGTFLKLFDASIQSAIKQVKIPCCLTAGNPAVSSGTGGLSTKIFLLSGYELGWTSATNVRFPQDGACLSYFSGLSATDSKRIAKLSNTAIEWWTRTPNYYETTMVWYVNTSGGCNNQEVSDSFLHGIRPALILPKTALITNAGTIVA